jgi:hypothetical protein
MNYTNRIRFEAVVKTNETFMSPDLDALLQDIIRRIGDDVSNAHISAALNITHEEFEQNVELKGFVPLHKGEEVVFTREPSYKPSAPTPEPIPSSVPTTVSPVISTQTPTIALEETITEPHPSLAVAHKIFSEQEQQFLTSKPLGEGKPHILNGSISVLDVIDALSRVKEISAWMDQSRAVMEDIPKIRNELKDITENLLKVLQNGQNGHLGNGQ